MRPGSDPIAGLPPFVSAADLVAEAADEVRPVEVLDAATAAERSLMVFDTRVGAFRPFSFDRAPYWRRPLECVSDPQFRVVAAMGPSQTGKSVFEMAAMSWAVQFAPGDVMGLFPDQSAAHDFSQSKWRPTIEASETLTRRLKPGAHSLSTWSQDFLRSTVWINWPVASKLRMYTVRTWIADDLDAIPEDIDKEGDPIVLLQGRTAAYDGRETGIAASSPALGVGKGIEALVASGTDERLHAPCPQCGEFFALDLANCLHFDRTATALDAADTAHLVCPTNGCVIEPGAKASMISAAVWVGPGQSVVGSGRLVGEARRSSIAGFRIDGLAGFVAWPRLAEMLREAELSFEATQKESGLRTFWNTRAGVNYRVQAENRATLEGADLREKIEGAAYSLGVVPARARYLTAAVDVQGNRFAVIVVAWGEQEESWIIARFDLFEHDGDPIRPHRVAACWDAIAAAVINRAWPIEGRPGWGLRPAVTAIDSNGLPGVTVNAKRFFKRQVAAGLPEWSMMLTSGSRSLTLDGLGRATFDTDPAGKRLPDAVPVFSVGVNALKSVVDVRLRFKREGGGFLHLPRDLSDEHRDELVAEEIVNGRWQKVSPNAANETLDLVVLAIAAHERLEVDRVEDWERFRPPYAVPLRIDPPASAEGEGVAGGGETSQLGSAASAVVARRGRRVRTGI